MRNAEIRDRSQVTGRKLLVGQLPPWGHLRYLWQAYTPDSSSTAHHQSPHARRVDTLPDVGEEAVEKGVPGDEVGPSGADACLLARRRICPARDGLMEGTGDSQVVCEGPRHALRHVQSTLPHAVIKEAVG